MIKFTGFTKAHVGCDVTELTKNRIGKIIRYEEMSVYPIVAEFVTGIIPFTTKGLRFEGDIFRTLYFPGNLKVEVTGEEVPEPALICPACGEEHDIHKSTGNNYFYFFTKNNQCPLAHSRFGNNDLALRSMRNLISAMEK